MLQQAFAAQPVIVEMAEEISARGRAIEQLQAEVKRLQAESEQLKLPATEAGAA